MCVYKNKLSVLALLVLGLVSLAGAVSVKPMYFIDPSTGAAFTDDAVQQEYWENLMKYKLWGTHSFDWGINYISIADSTGYNGTADGNMNIANNFHRLGGPTLIGGNMTFTNSDHDTLSLGPIRVLKNLVVSTQNANLFDVDWCVGGDITQQYGSPLTDWNNTIGGKVYNNGYTLSKSGGDYADCPASVPELETTLSVPIWPVSDDVWTDAPAINMNSNYQHELQFIHVPPDSVETNIYGTYDLYLTRFSAFGSTGKRLVVLMPPGGKLTRVYSRDGFFFDGSANDMKIMVAYIKSGTTYDKVNKKWDIATPAAPSWSFSEFDKMDTVLNTDYAGNLMFYTQNDISMPYFVDGSVQGSWISTKKITVSGHFKLAGQVIANDLEFKNNITGDFRYVPFDPPEIDPSLFAGQIYEEKGVLEKVPFTLSKVPLTDVRFKYCYEFEDHWVKTGERDSLDSETGDPVLDPVSGDVIQVPVYTDNCSGGCADPEDLNGSKVPLCGHDTATVVIPKEFTEPQVPESSGWIFVTADGIEEKTEKLKLNIIDLSGAVVKYGDAQYFQSSISVYIRIKDATDPNRDPIFDDACDTLHVSENVPADHAGVVSASDIDNLTEDLRYSIISQIDQWGAPVELFTIDPVSGSVDLLDIATNYETNQSYLVYIEVQDPKGGSDIRAFNINVDDVNENPIVKQQHFEIAENSPDYDPETLDGWVGKVVKSDIDSLNAKTTEREFVKHNIVEAIGGDTKVFQVALDGTIYVVDGDSLDYEKKTQYQLLIRVRDTSAVDLWDTATIFIAITDDPDDGPKFDTTTTNIDVPDTTVSNLIVLDKKGKNAVDENNPANVIVGAVKATCTDTNKALVYEITSDTSGLFSMDPATGVVSIKDPMVLDYETVSSYTITVKVSDGVVADASTGRDANGVLVQSDSRVVTIRVNDLNEDPIVAKQNFDVLENKPVGTKVGTVEASDIDTVAKFQKHSFEAVGGDTAFFAIDTKGNITTKAVLDYEKYSTTGDTLFSLIVKVNDVSDTKGLFALDTMTIALHNANENPAIVPDTIVVAEGTKGGTLVDTVTANDLDGSTDTLTYSLVGDSDLFVINEKTGEISVKDGAKIDYEYMQYAIVTIKVVDQSGASDTKDFYVKIVDVNEPPSIEDQSFSFKENDPIGTEKGPVKATDPDQLTKEYSTLTYSLVGESEKFDVLTDGTIKLIDTLDYEADSIYKIKVRVTDGTFSDTATVTIKIGDVMEYSEINITEASNIDSLWKDPDTLYVNRDDINICWKQGIKGANNSKEFCSDTTLTEGKNIIIKKFRDPSTNMGDADTLVVFVSTSSPIVTISKSEDPDIKTNIYTIEEPVDAKDSAKFFVNSNKHTVTVTVKDPVTKTEDKFSVKLLLDTVAVPTKEFNTLSDIADAILPLNENADNVIHTPINGEKVAVSYTEVVDGHTVNVTYYTDMDGNILDGESGEPEMTVSYTKVIDGKSVVLSFQAKAESGQLIESETGGSYKVSYDYVDSKKNSVNVTYSVNENGKLVKNKGGDVGYEVSYTYTNKYGNSATESLFIVLDTKPALVWIKSPSNDQTIYSNMAEVEWYVSVSGDSSDFVLQDTLIVQGLRKGSNTIIRSYMDKAGNMATDTVYVIMKDAKDVDINVEQPVAFVTADKVDRYYSDGAKPQKGQTFAVSIANPLTGDEKETLVGGTFKTKAGSGDTPYPGHSHHLGPTLGIDVKVPVYSDVGGLATLDDLVGKDGMIALEGVDAENSEKRTVDQYVKEYCSAEFASSYGSDITKANLYNTEVKVKIWVFTTLGTFVDYYTFTQEMNDPDYVNEAGLIKLYFEMKPDKDGYVRTESGRLYSTGAYIYKTEVEMKSVLNCTLPPVNEKSDMIKKGAVRKTTDDLLKNFGYKRPDYGKNKKK